MNADIEGALREAAARRPAAVWLRAFREFLDLSRMPPHFQRPLPLEAFLFGLDGSQ